MNHFINAAVQVYTFSGHKEHKNFYLLNRICVLEGSAYSNISTCKKEIQKKYTQELQTFYFATRFRINKNSNDTATKLKITIMFVFVFDLIFCWQAISNLVVPHLCVWIERQHCKYENTRRRA